MATSPSSPSYSSPGGGAGGAEDALLRLLAAVDDGSFNAAEARDCEDRGASLRQCLAYAMSRGSIRAVITLAYECAVHLDDSVKLASAREVLRMASQGDWATVAYHVALAADAEGDALDNLLAATDSDARKKLRQAAGEVRAQLPRDLRQTFSRTGKLPPVLHVELHRWLLPRPRKDQLFLGADGSKIEDGWYTVVHYPLGDDLKEALLRRKYWDSAPRDQAANLVRRVGETLLCKAAKAQQWDLADWILERGGNAVELAAQLQNEFSGLWENIERSAYLHDHEDLSQLCACLDNSAVLSRPWRHGALHVPSGARVKWPRLETLRDALALGPLSMQALQLVGAAKVTLVVPQALDAKRAWRTDLVALHEDTYACPLLHRAAEAGRTELMSRLLQAMVNVESCDSRGLAAVAVAASSRHWEALDVLLKEGCRVDGSSGALAMTAVQRATKPGPEFSLEEAELAGAMLERLYERNQRAPATTLEEYFRRQAKGEIIHGTQPRRYELQDAELHLRNGTLRVATRTLLLDSSAKEFDVCFVSLDPPAYSNVLASGIIDLARKPLYSEKQLIRDNLPLAAPVAVPCGRLASDGPEGALSMKADGRGPLASALPLIAKAAPLGGLRVESVTSCCRESIGRVEIIVDGVRVGETHEPAPLSSVSEELKLLVPARELEVVAEASGRRLKSERIVGGPDAEMCVEVGIGIFIYVQLVDEEQNLEFVFVCGHRRDVPEESKPFLGMVNWDNGSEQLASHRAVVLGEDDCLARCQSLKLVPTLPAGRCFEAVEWEDTSTPEQKACQFQRCIVNPVRVGKIFNG